MVRSQKRYHRCVVALAALLLFGGFASSREGSHGDDLLLLIPRSEYESQAGFTPASLRLYQNFGEHLLVGATREAAELLWASGIDAVILDEDPWGATYVVASSRGPDAAGVIRQNGGNILFRSNDLLLVRTDQRGIERLREGGVSCVEVSGEELPPPVTTLRLPERDVRTDSIASIVSLVSETSVSGYIQGLEEFGTRVWSRTNRDSVFSWVQHRFLDLGIEDVRLDSFQYGGTWQKNVVATIPGTVHPDAEIIVGGHLDSQNYSNPNAAPGADDNATGTVAAIEMARILKLIAYEPALTIRFIGFAAEEAGLVGSFHYAGEANQRGDDIKVMMNYDMLGYRNQGMTDRDFDIVWYTGSEAYSDLHAMCAGEYTTLTPIPTTSFRSSSDSWAFYQNGFHTLFCIEHDFNPYYHSQNDLLQYLDVPYATDIVRAGLAMLLILDQSPPDVPSLEVFDSGDGTSLFVQWESPGDLDVTGYNVYVGTEPGVYEDVYYQTGLFRTLSGLNEGTAYYIGVSAVDLVGREGMIVEKTGTPLEVPLPPAGLSSLSGDEGVELGWLPNRELDLDGYFVYRSADSAGVFVRMNTDPLRTTVWVDTSMFPLVNYYYVTAVDDASNESSPSDTVTGSPVVDVSDHTAGLPDDFRLHQNYPNPFNASTVIRYDVPVNGPVELTVTDLLGREVSRLVSGNRSPGRHAVIWDATDAASGVYFIVFRSGGLSLVRRAVLIR